tara:strand:- start:202 stop:831 length:630 start_codon:yes stop_codon:yes gene_type:complete
MSKWQVEIETHSRDDVMKVCALLAKGIGAKSLEKMRPYIHVHSDRGNSGKTAVIDGLVASFSDNHTAYELPTTSLVEDYPSHACEETIKKSFMIDGDEAMITLVNSPYDDSLLFQLKNWLKGVFNIVDERGLDLMTSFSFVSYRRSGVEIKFDDDQDYDTQNWNRSWKIAITNRKLRTPEMAEILDHLRSFHERRQSRLNPAPLNVDLA